MKICKVWHICVCLCLVGVLSACLDDEDCENKDHQESSYNRMGRLHNECLDYVLQEIISASPHTKGKGRKIPDMIEIRAMCAKFVTAKGENVETRSTIAEERDPFDWSGFPEERVEYLEYLEQIVRKSRPDQLTVLVNRIHRLENKLKDDTKISPIEQELLLNVMAVCRYSASYWAENYEKWQYELYGIRINKIRTRSEIVLSKEQWDKWGELILADGAGGIYNGQYVLMLSTEESVQKFYDDL